MPRGKGAKRRKTSDADVVLHAQGQGPVKRTQKNPYDLTGSDATVFSVREIKAEAVRKGKPVWLIGWEGFTDNEDTWKPIENLAGHEQEIAAFRKDKEERSRVDAQNNRANKKRKTPSEQQSASDEDASTLDENWVEGKGGKRKAACWACYKVRLCPEQPEKVLALCCKVCGPDSSPTWSGNTSNLRSHLAHIHKDLYCKMVEAESADSATTEETRGVNAAKVGTIEAMLPPISDEKRDELHKKSYLAALLAEGIMPSIAGDLWSEGGIAIFGILVYWIDKGMVLHEKLLSAVPFSDVRHTGLEIERSTKESLSDMGVGEYTLDQLGSADSGETSITVDTVKDFVHSTTSDSASNMISGWGCFDGHECNCHLLALCVLVFLTSDGVKEAFTKLRGMTTHFNHSVIGRKLLHDCQDKYGLSRTSPPQDNATRSGWKGARNQAKWFVENQAESKVKYNKVVRKIENISVQEARQNLLEAIEQRFFKALLACKLEDFAVSTFLDPRYKNLEFKMLEGWRSGTLTRSHIIHLARSAYEADWMPKESDTPLAVPSPTLEHIEQKSNLVSFLEDSDDDEDNLVSSASAAPSTKVEDEFKKYLSLPACDGNLDILEWWRGNSTELPNMVRMARQFLAAPASTAGVERTFSACGQMHSDLRKSVKEGTLQHSLMASINTK
ncbi:hypothetical protein CYMTET_55406 [Cymbomonas tetramitiformis]|uniref:Chromo domain-containing protein n=1 Tax=Cymbomonas tetramitiformis TaxID=36881 RepID=A0AAE0BEV8_9CHLO|nr:hypothetical protein CYMTET_55406 [Cymbomonas tetramitiformis]